MAAPFTIARLEAVAAPYPMRSAFTSAKRRSTVAENVLVTATLADGTVGYGEASAAEYVTGESEASVLGSVAAAAESVVGGDARHHREWTERLRLALPHAATARAAVEMALLDALTRELGIGLWHWFGGATTEVRTDLTIPIVAPTDAAATAREAAGRGFRSLKVKVGGPDPDADLERVLAIAGAAPAALLRLDANQAFTARAALAFTRDLLARGVRIELLEQPVPREDLEGLAAVTRMSPVPVFADEAVVNPGDAVQLVRRDAAHGINIKVAKAGLAGALEIIAIARASGLKLMLGCMLESLLGIGAALHLACGTGAFDYLDLDAHMLIGLEPTGRPFSQEGDRLRPDPEAVGIGWEPEG